MSIQKIKYGNHDNWLEIRREGIGGSEAGIIMGVNEYASELTLWADKVGAVKPVEANLAMEIGNYLEPLVAKEFHVRTGKRIREQHFMMRNDKYPWAIANIDRKVSGENAILECKTTGSIPRIRQFKTGQYPDEWYCQVQHYMAVGGYGLAYLACIDRNFQCSYNDWVIERDDEFIAEMMRREEAFWHKVITKTPPDPNGCEREKDVLAAMFEADDEKVCDLSVMSDRIKEYREYAALEKQYKQMKDAAKNAICMMMGDASIGMIGGDKVCTWKEQTKAAHMVKESTSRVFRLNSK